MPKISEGRRTAYVAGCQPPAGHMPNEFQKRFADYRSIKSLVEAEFVRADKIHDTLITSSHDQKGLFLSSWRLAGDLPSVGNKPLPAGLRAKVVTYDSQPKTMLQMLKFWEHSLQSAAQARASLQETHYLMGMAAIWCVGFAGFVAVGVKHEFDKDTCLAKLRAGWVVAILAGTTGFVWRTCFRMAGEIHTQKQQAKALKAKIVYLKNLLYGLQWARDLLQPYEISEKHRHGLIPSEVALLLEQNWERNFQQGRQMPGQKEVYEKNFHLAKAAINQEVGFKMGLTQP